MAYLVMAHIVMAYIVMAHIVMAYIVTAYVVMAYIDGAYQQHMPKADVVRRCYDHQSTLPCATTIYATTI